MSKLSEYKELIRYADDSGYVPELNNITSFVKWAYLSCKVENETLSNDILTALQEKLIEHVSISPIRQHSLATLAVGKTLEFTVVGASYICDFIDLGEQIKVEDLTTGEEIESDDEGYFDIEAGHRIRITQLLETQSWYDLWYICI